MVGWIKFVVVVYQAVRVWGRDVRDGGLLLFVAASSSHPLGLVPLGSSREYSLEMVFLKRKNVMSANRGLDSHERQPIRRRHAPLSRGRRKES